jgi:hypothetical protein
MTTTERKQMTQTAPYPRVLADLVQRLRYRVNLGWEVALFDDYQRDKPGRHSGESRGLTLVVTRCGPDTYHPERTIAVDHLFAVPPATYNEQSWCRWLFDRLGDVDTHERCEDFTLWPVHEDGKPYAETPPGGQDPALVRPYAPTHAPGADPYRVVEYASDIDRRTSFRGVLDDDGTGRSEAEAPATPWADPDHDVIGDIRALYDHGGTFP